MATYDATARPSASPRFDIRPIDARDLRAALGEGWKDFRERRGDLVFAGLIYPLVCIVAIYLTLNQPLLPLLFPLVAGISIAGPAVAAGFYEIARRAEAGQDASFSHFLDPLNGRARSPIATLTAGLALLFLGWLLVAYLLFDMTLGAQPGLTVGDFATQLFTTAPGWALIVLGNIAGFGFALATLVFAWVSFPMVVDKPVDAGTAIATSIRAVKANPRAALGWGARVAGLLVLGTIPFGVGLAIVLPWLGYATWHLYTRIVVR